MAEWLRRQPAKLMGYARVGSNPTVVDSVFFFPFLFCAFVELEPLKTKGVILATS
jgi:uncharacterized membrane protein (UPF0136 family)